MTSVKEIHLPWGLLVAIGCTIASMTLGGFVGLQTEGPDGWFMWLGLAHAICVFGCAGYARRWVWAPVGALASVSFPFWGIHVAMIGGMIVVFPGGVIGFETPTFAVDATMILVTSVLWTLLLCAVLGEGPSLLWGLVPPIGACVAMYIVGRPSPDMPGMYGIPIAVWHILMPPAIFFSAVRSRRAGGE